MAIKTEFRAKQAYFHHPSKDVNHDLEMHVIHDDSNCKPLIFLMKVVPDSYFVTHDDNRDDLLYNYAKASSGPDELDLTAVVRKLNQGWLTAPAYAEGKIPIRRSTLNEIVKQEMERFGTPEDEELLY